MPDSPASRMLQTFQTTSQPSTQQWLQPSSDDANLPTNATQQVITDFQPQQTIPSDTVAEPAGITDQQKLATFEAILSEMDQEKVQAEQAMAPVNQPQITEQPQQIAEPTQSQQPQQLDQPVGYATSGLSKEQAPGMGIASAELPGGMQYVESEPSPEISEEVESFLQKVEQDPGQLPQEIVIAAQEHAASIQSTLPQNVKVLPITQAQEVAGKKKNTSFSIKWLVTFSNKLAEMFKGKAVYRTE